MAATTTRPNPFLHDAAVGDVVPHKRAEHVHIAVCKVDQTQTP
jgi:hypothetical protein